MGGEIGSNSAASPTLEVLPKVGGLMFLDWLNRTNPNNLYPFLDILPSGNIFAGMLEMPDLLLNVALLTYCDRILQRSTSS